MPGQTEIAEMVPLSRAFELVDGMRTAFYGSLETEPVPVSQSLDRRLFSDVRAVERSPHFNMSTVDGYAVRSADGYPLKIISDVYAGDKRHVSLGKGETVYVGTGAAVPEGADAVLKIEDVTIDGNTIISGPSPDEEKNLVSAGSDFEADEAILAKDTVIGPPEICVMSAAGVEQVEVYRRIRVGILSTGDEIRNGMVRDSNSPMIGAMLQRWGCEAVHIGTVPDLADETKAMLDDATAGFDIVITIGGVSVGKKDFVVSTIMGDGNVVFHGYKLRPGKPLLVSYYHGKPVFSLPGKPTGSFTAMELIVKRFLLGASRQPSTISRLARDVAVRAGDFEHVVYVQLMGPEAVPIGYEGSLLSLFSGPQYRVSLVSSSPKAVLADGFFMARESRKKGDEVIVTLL
jgi:molybdopterin molybdotransferase